MVLKQTLGAALLRTGVSAAILACMAGAALAESELAETPDEEVIYVDLPTDPICADCNGEVIWLEIEEELLITIGVPDEEDFLVDEGVPVKDGGEVVIEAEGEFVITTTDCDGCELQNMAGEPSFVQRELDGVAPSGTNADVPLTQRPNICTTPELYAAWLCEWQGFARP